MSDRAPCSRSRICSTHFFTADGHHPRGRRRVASTSTPARRWASSANPAAARASRPCRSCGCCRRRLGRTVGGSIRFEGRDLLGLDEAQMRAIRGNRIAMIFQEPMTSLNPVLTIGRPDRRGRDDPRGQGPARGRCERAVRDAEAGAHSRRRARASTTIRTSSPAACASA